MGVDLEEVKRRFSESALKEICYQIEKANGNEVFFSGKTNSEGVVVDVFAASRGNVDSVLVNIPAASDADVFIHNHPSGNLTPSDADLEVASGCVEEEKGFFIINNDVSDVYVVIEPPEKIVIAKLNEKEVSGYLSKNGPLSKIYEKYEERESQIELSKKITSVFNSDSIGVFEAGTGVGKSFAYLIPSMLWSLKNKERVVISTGTINLQQQIFEKDIPLAERIINQKIRAVLVKGRQNFLCLRRLSEISNEPNLFEDESDEKDIFDKIVKWSKVTKNGSKSDLSFQPPESIWQRVNSESDACMGMRCKHFAKCFVMKMKKEAGEANLIIVNHHILFADIESRLDGAGFDSTAVLPPYNRIVFDEAHGIESAATSFFSSCLNRFKIIKQLNLLHRRRKGSVSGFLFTLSALSDCEDKTAEIEILIEDAKNIFSELEEKADALLRKEFSIRLHNGNSAYFGELLSKMSEFQSVVRKIVQSLKDILDGISEEDKDDGVVWESRAVVRRIESFVTIGQNFSEWNNHQELVFWIQRSKLPQSMITENESPFYYQFMQTPLDIAPLMNEGVFDPMKSIICTSATIGIEGKFDFWEKNTGVNLAEEGRIFRGEFKSPFPYDRNMVFAVPSDAPFPDNPQFQQFVEKAVSDLIKAAGGRTLVLFTSYEMLRKTYDAAKNVLKEANITLLKQGDDDRFRLQSKFKEDTSSVLFATDSFWEGVDVPGESLSQVIIVKLPFGVPSDPVFSARSELIEKAGGNSFMELSVPGAVIKFRQGFGRLIRRGDDKGAVVVLDRRIVEKRYGSIFTKSIPNSRRLYEPLENMVKSVKIYF